MLDPPDPGGGSKEKLNVSRDDLYEIVGIQGKKNEFENNKIDNSLKDNNKKNTEKRQILYRCQDPGPYVVFVESTEKSGNFIGKFNDLKIAKEICDLKLDEVKKIKNKGTNRVSIEFSGYVAANNLVKNETLADKGYNIYIPYNFTTCKGIVRGIHKSLDIQEIMEIYEAPVKILNITRLNRKIISKDGEKPTYEPTNTILITFEGVYLPKILRIYKIEKKVIPYIAPVTLCFRCLRFGHTKKQCKSKIKCFNCGGDVNHQNLDSEENASRMGSEFTCEVKCVHCESREHKSNNKTCPEFLRQKEIKRIMAYENLTFFDASALCPKKSIQDSNIFHPAEFPPLKPSNRYLTDQLDINEKIAPGQRRSADFNSSPKRTFQQAVNEPTKKRMLSKGYNKEEHEQALLAPSGRTASQKNNNVATMSSNTDNFPMSREDGYKNNYKRTPNSDMPNSAQNINFDFTENFQTHYENLSALQQLKIKRIVMGNRNVTLESNI